MVKRRHEQFPPHSWPAIPFQRAADNHFERALSDIEAALSEAMDELVTYLDGLTEQRTFRVSRSPLPFEALPLAEHRMRFVP